MNILFKYASRSRPARFFEGLHNIIDLINNKDEYKIWCVLDQDDPTIDEDFRNTIQANGERFQHVIFDYGKSSSKIDAINRPLSAGLQYDILVNFSDDMRFTVTGFDQLIREHMACQFPDLDGVLHYPDQDAGSAVPTMYIAGRPYVERDGYIYHSSYESLWCDNEAMIVAKMRGKYHYCGVGMINHLHPAYGHVLWDEQYLRQQALWNKDSDNFIERLHRKFDLADSEIVNLQPWQDVYNQYILLLP